MLQLLFFGNRRQSLTDFVLQDLGVTRYYPYQLNREHRLFSCREARGGIPGLCGRSATAIMNCSTPGNPDQLPRAGRAGTGA